MWGSEWPPELYYQMMQKQRAGGSGAGGFSPISQAPHSWYDPSDLTTLFQDAAMTTPVTAADDPVGAMLDKSGNGNHVIQATAGKRPLYKTSGGLRWLEFDGADDFLADAFALSQPWDAVTALRRIDATNDVHFIGGSGGNDNTGVLYFNTEVRIFSGSELSSGVSPASGVDFVATERHSGASSRIAVDNGSYVTGDAGATARTGICIGAGVAGSANFANCRFYGRVMKSAFTDEEIALLRTYLAAKQGRIL